MWVGISTLAVLKNLKDETDRIHFISINPEAVWKKGLRAYQFMRKVVTPVQGRQQDASRSRDGENGDKFTY